MMRIKEAVLRKKIIQQLNEDWREYEDEIAALLRSEAHNRDGDEQAHLRHLSSKSLAAFLRVVQSLQPNSNRTASRGPTASAPAARGSLKRCVKFDTEKRRSSPKAKNLKINNKNTKKGPRKGELSRTPSPVCPGATVPAVQEESTDSQRSRPEEPSNVHSLQPFVDELQNRMTVYQKRALRVTWKRLSEAPKTSGRGTIHIMQKILDKMIELEPKVPALFYKSAFLSCIQDRQCGRNNGTIGTISTTRDHALIFVEYIGAILQLMFEGTTDKDLPSPEQIGQLHIKLYPLGFDRHMWQVLGESFAEVMFAQECVRAYPHAASAWSLLALTFTDKMYSSCKPPKDFKKDSKWNYEQVSPSCPTNSNSSDSGCPSSNKNSLRSQNSDTEQSSEATSGVDSCSPLGHRPHPHRMISIRPPSLFVPTNLIRSDTPSSSAYSNDYQEPEGRQQETSFTTSVPSRMCPQLSSPPPEPPIDYPLDSPDILPRRPLKYKSETHLAQDYHDMPFVQSYTHGYNSQQHTSDQQLHTGSGLEGQKFQSSTPKKTNRKLPTTPQPTRSFSTFGIGPACHLAIVQDAPYPVPLPSASSISVRTIKEYRRMSQRINIQPNSHQPPTNPQDLPGVYTVTPGTNLLPTPCHCIRPIILGMELGHPKFDC